MCDGWAASVVLNVLLGAFGAFFVFKEFGDPAFSDWLSPGAGQALLGDSGRMLMYEAGDDGVQSILLGAPAWLVEGIVLGVGTLGVLLSPWSSTTAQLLCAFAVPVEGVYYLINVVYFPLVAMPEMVGPMVVMGGGLVAVSLWRVHTYLAPRMGPDFTSLYHSYLMLLGAALLGVGLRLYTRAAEHTAEIASLVRVREHFVQNGMAWSEGLPLPDGMNSADGKPALLQQILTAVGM